MRLPKMMQSSANFADGADAEAEVEASFERFPADVGAEAGGDAGEDALWVEKCIKSASSFHGQKYLSHELRSE